MTQLSITEIQKATIVEKRSLMRSVNRTGSKLIAIQSMALRISELDPSEPESQSLIIALSESIGLIAEEANGDLNTLTNVIMEK